jgi:hypothetical protein
MSTNIKYPFDTIEEGKHYIYSRPGYIRGMRVDVEMKEDSRYVKFNNGMDSRRITAIPCDAEFNEIVC